MKELLITGITFILSSSYILFLDHLANSNRVIQKALVLPFSLFLIILYISTRLSKRNLIGSRDKWYLLFLSAIASQLLVISTGGLNSPFLILIHLLMIVISFACNFGISLLFLFFSFVVMIIDILFIKNMGSMIIENPTPYILQITSLIPIIPISYLISQHYHNKDTLSKILNNKVLTDEVIMSHLDELIIITDPQLHILSVNDAVERTLQLSRTQLLDVPIFEALLLRDKNGNLVTKETLFSENKIFSSSKKIIGEFFLLRTSLPNKNITLHIQSIKDLQGKISQISFIINPNNSSPPAADIKDLITGKARASYDAMSIDIKNKLLAINQPEIRKQLLILEKLEDDIYQIQALKPSSIKQNIAKIDAAQLCKQIVQSHIDFASAFNVPVEFTIQHFGLKDIAPLTVKNYPVKPEQLTGPFFTIENDVKHIQIILKKLLDISTFLASSEKSPFVTLTIERDGKNFILIKINGSCPELTKDDFSFIFQPYYGKLNNKTNLHLGSGLEGYLVKKINEMLVLSLEVNNTKQSPSCITFSLRFRKYQS